MKASINPAVALATALLLTSCNGIFSDIYDDFDEGTASADGFTRHETAVNRYTLSIDASDFGVWHYVSLKNQTVENIDIPQTCSGDWDGRSGITYNEVAGDAFTALSYTPTDPQRDAAVWDFAIHRFEVKTNGGAVAKTRYTSLDEFLASDSREDLDFVPDCWSTTDVMVDISGMMAYHIGYQNSEVNRQLSEWVKMDISTPPPTYSMSGTVYVMRLNDNTLAALRLKNYMNANGVKGHLTVEIIYPL